MLCLTRRVASGSPTTRPLITRRPFSVSQVVSKNSLFETQLRKQAIDLGVPVNQAPPELRTQIRERLQFTLRQLNLPHDGTNPELRQRLRDYELGETARELREKGALEFDGTETWMDLRQKVLGYYETELAQRGISAKGSLKERKERLRFCLEGALPVETKAEQKKKKLTKKK